MKEKKPRKRGRPATIGDRKKVKAVVSYLPNALAEDLRLYANFAGISPRAIATNLLLKEIEDKQTIISSLRKIRDEILGRR